MRNKRAIARGSDPTRRSGISRRAFLAGTGAFAGGVWLKSISNANAQVPATAGTLTLGQAADVANFDPFYTILNNNYMFRALYDSLIRIESNGTIMPQLAESWSLAKDASSMQIELRKGVRFHSGRELDASDVVYSVKFVQDSKHFSQLRSLFLPIVEMQTPGKYTVVMRFSKPYPAVTDPLNGLYILDKDNATDLKAKPSGSGPFIVERWEPGHELRLARNKNYWNARRVHLDRIIIKTIGDPTSLGPAIQAGDVDVIFNFPLAQYVGLQRDPRLRTSTGSTGASAYDLSMNVQRPVFANKLFRQAINYALDRVQFARSVLYGLAPTRTLPFPSYSIGYFKDLDAKYTYDLNKARALVKQAGMEGASFAAIASAQAIPGSPELGEILQASLKQIGISMTVQNLEAARYYDLDHASNFEMMIHEFGGVTLTDPDSILNGTIVWLPENNVTKYSSAQYTRLVKEAGSTVEVAQRKKLYRQIDELALDECWCVPVASAPSPWAVRQKVKGFGYDVANYPIYTDALVGA